MSIPLLGLQDKHIRLVLTGPLMATFELSLATELVLLLVFMYILAVWIQLRVNSPCGHNLRMDR